MAHKKQCSQTQFAPMTTYNEPPNKTSNATKGGARRGFVVSTNIEKHYRNRRCQHPPRSSLLSHLMYTPAWTPCVSNWRQNQLGRCLSPDCLSPIGDRKSSSDGAEPTRRTTMGYKRTVSRSTARWRRDGWIGGSSRIKHSGRPRRFETRRPSGPPRELVPFAPTRVRPQTDLQPG